MNKSDFKNLEEAYSKINESQRLIEENDSKEVKSALLTVRLPHEVKEDLQRVADTRKVKMTTVVETYFTAGRAMENLKVSYPKLYESIISANSPEQIAQILQSLVSGQMSLESYMVEENILQTIKHKLASSEAAKSAKAILILLLAFAGGITKMAGTDTDLPQQATPQVEKAGIPLLSDVLYIYAQHHRS